MGNRDEGGEKKDKIVISKLSHALHDNLPTLNQGKLSKIWGPGSLAEVRIWLKRRKPETLSSLVVKMSWSFAISSSSVEVSDTRS